MAHADYDCCAICDCKLSYAGYADADTKESICETCLKRLQKEGLPIVAVDQLLKWIETAPKAELREKLQRLGFRACYYKNDVDEAVLERGLVFNNDGSVK